MKERPILFTVEMVRAILDQRKTQTRRLVKPQPSHATVPSLYTLRGEGVIYKCPYGRVGDRLWVRETFLNNALNGYRPVFLYRADSEDKPPDRKWKPSIYMPRWASRLTLQITGVRVQRVQEINDSDAKAEGVNYPAGGQCSCYAMGYKVLWDSINGKKAPWRHNPWVWAITFKKL